MEHMAEITGHQRLVEEVTELSAQLQSSPVLADGAVEVAQDVAKLAEVLPDRRLEGGGASEQRLGPGERLEGRFVVAQAFALEQTQAEEGLSLTPWQA